MFNKIMIKPTEIEYVQFTEENKKEVFSELRRNQYSISTSYDRDDEPCLLIPTTKGEMICHIGDYIIKDSNPKSMNQFICCAENVFKCLMKTFGMEVV